jgi:hypothetical protein
MKDLLDQLLGGPMWLANHNEPLATRSCSQTFPRRCQSARSRLVLANRFRGPGVVWATTWALHPAVPLEFQLS